MDSELRPCPFCGGLNIRLAVGVGCKNDLCAAQGPMFSDKDVGLEKWNSAWCWKEIDSLRSTIKLQSETHWKEHERHDKEIKENYEAQIRVLENEIRMLKGEK